MTTGVSIVTASFDLIGDGMINWANYLLLGTSIVLAISSAAIQFFTYECQICGKLVIRNDNYCKRCGTDLIRKTVLTTYEKIQTESPKELPSLPQSPQESNPLPFTRTRTRRVKNTVLPRND